MEIKQVSIAEIKPYYRNPRKNESAVAAVKKSIERYGFAIPILLDMEGVIIAGHTRYKAALELGLEVIPCVYSAMEPKLAKEYRIADNKTAELAQWDLANLKLEMREVDAFEVPGFSDAEMKIFFSDISFGGVADAAGADVVDYAGGASPSPSTKSFSDYDPAKEGAAYEKQEAKMHTAFEGASKEAQDAYVNVTCPHCAGEFTVDGREVMRQIGK
jgi:hypothetical protein